MDPETGAVHAKVKGTDPVEVAASATVPVDATVYGPPALATGNVQPPTGMMLLGQGLSAAGARVGTDEQ